MNKPKKEKEVKPKPKKSAKVPRLFVSIMNGTFLTRNNVLGNMSFILFIALLMLSYIAYGYYTERTVRDLQKVDAELKELRSEYITIRSNLETKQLQSQVAQDISPRGIEESRVPPQKIEVEDRMVQTSRQN